MWCRGSHRRPRGETRATPRGGGGTCFPVSLFSRNERLILERVHVKYLSSLRSHVYRFISLGAEGRSPRRGKAVASCGRGRGQKLRWGVREGGVWCCEGPGAAVLTGTGARWSGRAAPSSASARAQEGAD